MFGSAPQPGASNGGASMNPYGAAPACLAAHPYGGVGTTLGQAAAAQPSGAMSPYGSANSYGAPSTGAAMEQHAGGEGQYGGAPAPNPYGAAPAPQTGLYGGTASPQTSLDGGARALQAGLYDTPRAPQRDFYGTASALQTDFFGTNFIDAPAQAPAPAPSVHGTAPAAPFDGALPQAGNAKGFVAAPSMGGAPDGQRGDCLKCGVTGHCARDCPNLHQQEQASATMPNAVPEPDGPKPLCHCGTECIVLCVRKEGPTQGRYFFKCPRPSGGGVHCNYFQWADEAPPAPGPQCACRVASRQRTVAKDGPNKGRPYYSCFRRQCSFFVWGDNEPGTLGGAGVPTPARAQPVLNGPPCRCGQPSVQLTVRKEGANQGRLFYKCGRQQGQGQCDFFQWVDEAAADGGSYRAGTGVCFKCGAPGHWASNCPNSKGAGMKGDGGGGKGECFKYGQPGHWPSNCPNAGAGGGGGKAKGWTGDYGYAAMPIQKRSRRGDGALGPYGPTT